MSGVCQMCINSTSCYFYYKHIIDFNHQKVRYSKLTHIVPHCMVDDYRSCWQLQRGHCSPEPRRLGHSSLIDANGFSVAAPPRVGCVFSLKMYLCFVRGSFESVMRIWRRCKWDDDKHDPWFYYCGITWCDKCLCCVNQINVNTVYL